jgi:hypothetical protein
MKRDLLVPVTFGCQHDIPNEKTVKEHLEQCWNTKIVRQRLYSKKFEDLAPAVYYSIAVTETHYFILYAFYHADDKTHPNDLEGCLLTLEKNGINKPKLYGMITIAHHDFVPYVRKDEREPKIHPLWQDKFEIRFEEEKHGDNVLIQQTKAKHPLYSIGRDLGVLEYLELRGSEIIGRPDDVIVYFSGDEANTYTKDRLEQGKGTRHNPTFFYKLIDIVSDSDSLYDRYKDAKEKHGGNETFTKEGKFHKSPDSLGQANGPWLWKPQKKWFKDHVGHIWEDPATLVAEIFDLEEKKFSKKYWKKMDSREYVEL